MGFRGCYAVCCCRIMKEIYVSHTEAGHWSPTDKIAEKLIFNHHTKESIPIQTSQGLLLSNELISFFQMHVLHVLSFVIERVGSKIRPFIGSLVQYLPLLWKESEEHNMLRCAILTSLIHLVQVRLPQCNSLLMYTF